MTLKGYVFALLAAVFLLLVGYFPIFINVTVIKTVNFDEWFEWPESFDKYYKYFSKVMKLNK